MDTSKVELLYCKSKVYIHPSKSSKDNIAGYLALIRPNGASDLDILLSWVPEYLIRQSKDDFDNYVQVDLDPKSGAISESNRVMVSPPPSNARSSHAFSIAIRELFSIQVRQPSLGWWWGSLLFYTRTQVTLPALFFHDSESQSTVDEQKRNCESFEPFSDSGELSWGGMSFLSVLRKHAKLVDATVERGLLLVNPDVADKLSFSPAAAKLVKTQPGDENIAKLSKAWEDAKWGLMEKLAAVTRFSRKAGQQVLDRTPANVKAMLKVPEVEQLSNDFDSARIYLAEWALGIAENSDPRYDVVWMDSYDDLISSVGATDEEYDVISLANSVERRNPVTLEEWNSFFDLSGRLALTQTEVLDRIFHGGLEPSVRSEGWLFLLGVFPWDSNAIERQSIVSEKRNEYYRLKRHWWDDTERQNNDEFWKDQKHRIEKDVLRTDRHLEIFGQSDIPHPDPDSRFASQGANPHLEQMKDMLITYNEYNENLGYIQGMSDLLSPLYVVLQDDALAFWAFCQFMRRMERNFLRDQSGMHDQLKTLESLVRFMLPQLFEHLEKAESTHFFFFFRMLLVWYKREFEWSAVLRLWEVLWTDYYSSQFHLFLALAILDLNKEVIMAQLHHFDEVLKYINELGESLDIDVVLVRAEQLFQRFSNTIDLIDRRRKDGQHATLPSVPESLRQLRDRKIVEVRETVRPEGATGG